MLNRIQSMALLVSLALPFGVLAHRLVLSFPRLFHNAGWDIEPLEPVKLAEQYLVRYRYQQRHWATNSWRRTCRRDGYAASSIGPGSF